MGDFMENLGCLAELGYFSAYVRAVVGILVCAYFASRVLTVHPDDRAGWAIFLIALGLCAAGAVYCVVFLARLLVNGISRRRRL